MKGRIIFSSGGNYKVLVENNIFNAKPLGIFRNNNIKILVGDIVDIKINENKKGLNEINVITNLYERKNEFVRPNISNVDNVIIVTSIVNPKLNDYYLDKLITIFQSFNVQPILIFTKNDIEHDIKLDKIICEYIDAEYKVLITNNSITSKQKNQLKNWLNESFSVITGQTGVGKSTFINLLNKKFNLKVSEISKSLNRGKHTTRHSEAFEVFDNTYLIDTPGFSSLSINKYTKEEISWNFFTFSKYAGKCKFNNCNHIDEIECNVKKNIHSSRIWDNYLKLIKEVNNASK